MKKFTITGVISLFLVFQSFGQINPIENLTWEHNYEFQNNYFILQWDEPELPHDDLIGYNIYREDELYRFQTETSLYNLEQGSNCDEDFLFYDINGFFVHVTAVYDPGNVESSYSETVFIEGPLLNIQDTKIEKPIFYPNPTGGIVNIGNKGINRILIFNMAGNKVKEWGSQSKIDLSEFSKGVYLIKLISDRGVLIDKVVVK